MEGNPTVEIALTFQDGSGLAFKLSKPISQRQVMAWVGRLLAKTDNLIDLKILQEEEEHEDTPSR
jgi:hypothetical protein